MINFELFFPEIFNEMLYFVKLFFKVPVGSMSRCVIFKAARLPTGVTGTIC